MKHGVIIEYLKCRANLNFEVGTGTIVMKWDLNIFGKCTVFIHNIIIFSNPTNVPSSWNLIYLLLINYGGWNFSYKACYIIKRIHCYLTLNVLSGVVFSAFQKGLNQNSRPNCRSSVLPKPQPAYFWIVLNYFEWRIWCILIIWNNVIFNLCMFLLLETWKIPSINFELLYHIDVVLICVDIVEQWQIDARCSCWIQMNAHDLLCHCKVYVHFACFLILCEQVLYTDGFTSKPHKSILLIVRRDINWSICLLILLCLMLTNCIFNRFPMLRFERDFDSLCGVIIST